MAFRGSVRGGARGGLRRCGQCRGRHLTAWWRAGSTRVALLARAVQPQVGGRAGRRRRGRGRRNVDAREPRAAASRHVGGSIDDRPAGRVWRCCRDQRASRGVRADTQAEASSNGKSDESIRVTRGCTRRRSRSRHLRRRRPKKHRRPLPRLRRRPMNRSRSAILSSSRTSLGSLRRRCRQCPRSSGVLPPRRITEVRPIYPDLAKAVGIEGDVVLRVTVRADGSVGTVQVAAIAAPFSERRRDRGGAAVQVLAGDPKRRAEEATTNIAVRFRLKD